MPYSFEVDPTRKLKVPMDPGREEVKSFCGECSLFVEYNLGQFYIE